MDYNPSASLQQSHTPYIYTQALTKAMCEVTLSVYLTYQVLHIVSHYSSYYYILLYLALLQSFWICLRYSVCSLPDFLPIAVDGFCFTFWNCAPVPFK